MEKWRDNIMKNLFISILSVLLASAQYAYAAFPTSGSSQEPYCQVPPYVAQNVKPNINLILDFSGSMQFPAYLDCADWIGYDSSKVANCGTYTFSSTSLYKYNPARGYFGNFKSNFYYKYNSTGGYFEENPSCTNTDFIGSISSNCLSGNLLNWAVTTRTDVLRKILTGGRIRSSTTDVLESEGSRYVVTDRTLQCKFTVSASSTLTRRLSVADESSTRRCVIGTFSNYNMDVKQSDPEADISGIIQDIYSPQVEKRQVDLLLSVYNTSVNTVYRVGKNKNTSDYLNAINSELAYNGTPTGEAVREARYYYQQLNSLSSTNRAAVLGKTDYRYDPYYEPGNLPAYCRKSFVLLISDGEWNGSVDPVDPAHYMRKNDLRTEDVLPGKQNVTTYTVYAFGDGIQGRQAMITTAIFGGYDDKYTNGWPYPFTSLPNSLNVSYPLARCNPAGTWDKECEEWDKTKTGLPYNFFEADDGAALQGSISDAVQSILGRITSGTAASILGNNDNDGAMLLQALYYPERLFDSGDKLSWAGELQSLWYYVDPLLESGKITIREDSVADKKLNLKQDNVASFDFTGTNVEVNLYADADGDGAADDLSSPSGTAKPEDVNTLWRAGLSLWKRLPSGVGGRTVYTKDLSGTSSTGLMTFNAETTTRDLLKGYLDVANNSTDAGNVIKYTLGEDLTSTGYRSRTVDIGGQKKVWKLGDIINSTPKILSGSQLNTYNNKIPGGYSDASYETFVGSKNYKSRGAAFVGANDGMLHAFYMGKSFAGKSGFVTEINNADRNATPTELNNELGKEMWGYVPKNVLPYLKHLGNPSYKHLYYVDSTPIILDVSIGEGTKFWKSTTETVTCAGDPYYTCPKVTTRDPEKNFDLDTDGVPTQANPTVGTSWRTVLIGSMGLGGATRNAGTDCSAANVDKMCVATPISGTGYSSYFALDVTNPDNPKLLWEFAHPRLGFSTVRPAVVRANDTTDDGNPQRNGRWFVVLASGPTGPIDGTNQMRGYSNQPLTLFVLDLKTGETLRTISSDSAAVITGVGHTQYTGMPAYAFGGSFSDATIDTDRWNSARPGNYTDDAVYLGYVMKDPASSATSPKFTKGGVIRILTGDDPDPAKWKVSKVIEGIGPVSSAVTKLQDTQNRKLWLYFGTGRYFYKSGASIDDDYSGQQEAIYGIKEPCYNGDENDLTNVNCTDSVNAASLVNQTTTISEVTNQPGWKINLARADGSYNAQRIVTNPVPSSAGILFFTAFQPSTEVCSYGGRTSLWAVTYNKGGAPSDLLRGQALLQLSTGAFEQMNLAEAFTKSGGRETEFSQGVPPGPEPTILSNADHFPSKKVLHIMER